MKYNKMYILAVLLILSISISAQSVISGKVIDKDNTPIAGVTILLITHADSTYITGAISDLDGLFEIPNLKPDNYILSFSMMGLKKSNIEQQVGLNTKNELGNIVMEEDSYMLSAVTLSLIHI